MGFSHSGPVRELEESALDWMMKMYRGTDSDAETVPFALIDVDEETYAKWKEPIITPRDKLKTLIAFAVRGEPRVIIVDFDLSRERIPAESADRHTGDRIPADADDAAFRDFIVNYGKNPGGAGSDAPPLILIRTFTSMSTHQDSSPLQVRKTFLDGVVESNDHVHWASTLFELEHDFTIRRWRLWEKCVLGRECEVVPSVQMLVLLMMAAEGKDQKDLSDDLGDFKRYLCDIEGDNLVLTETEHQFRFLNKIHLSMKPDELNRRIIYEIPWRLEENEVRPLIKKRYDGGAAAPLIVVHSAGKIVDHFSQADVSWLKDRVVVIGASFKDSRDIYPTPIGQMPGALILINAIHSLISYGEMKAPSRWVKIGIEIILIIIMTIAFSRFSSFWGMAISGGAIIVLLLPLSFFFFRSGIWIDFAIPLFAVQLHQMASEFERHRQDRIKKERHG
jgi:hypothetical protein